MSVEQEVACQHKRVFKTAMLAARAAEFLNGATQGTGRTWYRCPACRLWHFRTPRTRRERETVLSHRNHARKTATKGATA